MAYPNVAVALDPRRCSEIAGKTFPNAHMRGGVGGVSRNRFDYTTTAHSFLTVGSVNREAYMLNDPHASSPRSVIGDGGFINQVPNTGFPIFDRTCYGLMVHFRGEATYDQVAAAVNDAALRGAENLKAYAKKSLSNSLNLKENPQSQITDRGVKHAR